MKLQAFVGLMLISLQTSSLSVNLASILRVLETVYVVVFLLVNIKDACTTWMRQVLYIESNSGGILAVVFLGSKPQ